MEKSPSKSFGNLTTHHNLATLSSDHPNQKRRNVETPEKNKESWRSPKKKKKKKKKK